jgi:hypothetical protein
MPGRYVGIDIAQVLVLVIQGILLDRGWGRAP